MDITTRDYENILPECGTATIVSINDLNEMGIYVSLLEFDNIEGLLLFSEVSRRRIRSISKLIKIGKKEIVSIIRVDIDKNYIDVSKRQITEIEINYMKRKRNYGKIVNLISNNVARYFSLNFEETRLRWVWQIGRKFYNLIKGFKIISKANFFFISSIDLSINEQKIFMNFLKKKMPTNVIKVEVELEMSVFCSNGIEILKRSLINTKNNPLYSDICYKTLISPRYLIYLTGETKKKVLKLLIKFLTSVSNIILEENGIFQVIKIAFI